MSTVRYSNVEPVERQRQSHRPKNWKAIPAGVKILVGICLLILIVIPVVKQRGLRVDRSPEIASIQESAYRPGLIVEEATLDRSSRTIKGVVRNRSDKTMDDVEVSYDLQDDQFELTDQPAVAIGSLKPQQSARFETGKLSPTGFLWSLHSLTGHPR